MEWVLEWCVLGSLSWRWRFIDASGGVWRKARAGFSYIAATGVETATWFQAPGKAFVKTRFWYFYMTNHAHFWIQLNAHRCPPTPHNHLWHHSPCACLSCPDLIGCSRWGCMVSSGAESLHREMGVNVKMGVGDGPCRCGSDQLPLALCLSPGDLKLSGLLLSVSFYCYEHVQQLDCKCAEPFSHCEHCFGWKFCKVCLLSTGG